MRIVDADALVANLAAINEGGKEYIRGIETAIGVIEEMEPEDCVNGVTILCRDCDYYDRHDKRCKYFNHGVDRGGFCAWAKLTWGEDG